MSCNSYGALKPQFGSNWLKFWLADSILTQPPDLHHSLFAYQTAQPLRLDYMRLNKRLGGSTGPVTKAGANGI